MGCDPVNPFDPNDPDNPGNQDNPQDTTTVDPGPDNPNDPDKPDQPTDTANIVAHYNVPNYRDINYMDQAIMDAEGLELVISRMEPGVYVYKITEKSDYEPEYYMLAKAKDGSVLVGKDREPGNMFRILEGGAYKSASMHAFDGNKTNYDFVTNPTEKHVNHYLYKDVYESRTAALADQLNAPGFISEYARLSVLAFCCEAYKLGDPKDYRWEMEETTLDGEQVKHFSIYTAYGDVDITFGKPEMNRSSEPIVEYWVDKNWMTLQVIDTRMLSYIKSFDLVSHQAAPQTLEDSYQILASAYKLDGYKPFAQQVLNETMHINKWYSELYPSDFETKKFLIPYTGSGTIYTFGVYRDGEWPSRSVYIYDYTMDGICTVEVIIDGATYEDVKAYITKVKSSFPYNRIIDEADVQSGDMAVVSLQMDNWDWEIPQGLEIDYWMNPEINLQYKNTPLINLNRFTITFPLGTFLSYNRDSNIWK